jgi:hypothetical protein
VQVQESLEKIGLKVTVVVANHEFMNAHLSVQVK